MKALLLLGFALVFLVPSTAFGAEGYFERDYGRTMNHSPTVCVFQPNDIRIDEQRWNNWYYEAKKGIDSWRSVLDQSGSGIWNIEVVNVPLEKLDLLNESACDVKVKYVREVPHDGHLAFGVAYIGTGNIEIAYPSFYACDRVYDSELGIFVNSYCLSNDFFRSKQMGNTVKHEFGHIIGLGHYRGYDTSITQKWYDTGIGSPSIMAWIEPNEEWRDISSIDVNKIKDIYGSKGFGKKIYHIDVFNERIVAEPQIYTSEKTGIQVSKDKPKTKIIQGSVPDKLYKRGMYVDIIIERPDGKVDHKGASVSKTLKKYKTQLMFGDSDPAGVYKITHKFNGKEFYKEEITISKSSTSYKPSNQNISKNIDRDTDNDGIKDSADFCKTKPETYNGYRDTDGCPDKEQIYKAKTPIFTIHQKNMMTQKIDTVSESLFKLKDGMDITWNYLDEADSKYTDSQAKIHVQKAWNLYNKLYDQRIDSSKTLEGTISGYLHLQDKTKTSNWNHYNEFTGKFDKINSNISKIGSDMKYISQELEYAQKAQNSVKKDACVSWWC